MAPLRTVTVQSVDARANTLTVQTLDTNEVSYNPALAKKLTGQSTVFREEHRDLAIGERIQLTQSDQRTPVRSGDFATVERIGEDNSLSVRLDNGKSVELDSERARHIDYGYAVEGPHQAVDRVLITGDALQLAQEEKMFSHLSAQTRDLALYTSDSRELLTEKAVPNLEVGMSRQDGIASSLDNLPTPSVPALPVEELGIGL